MASAQTLTDLQNAVNVVEAAVALVQQALSAANNDDATIEAAVANLNTAASTLTDAAGTPPTPPVDTPTS